jgi:hypothetical protein
MMKFEITFHSPNQRAPLKAAKTVLALLLLLCSSQSLSSSSCLMALAFFLDSKATRYNREREELAAKEFNNQ